MLIDTQPVAGQLGTGFAATAGFFTIVGVKGAVGGQIGDVRIGGNATNFTTIVADPARQAIDKISNYSIGGETNNVMLVAPNGARNVVFGKGMDTAEIFTHVINTLKANRGALNSRVLVDRTISSIQFGGDVDSTTVQSGVDQNFNAILVQHPCRSLPEDLPPRPRHRSTRCPSAECKFTSPAMSPTPSSRRPCKPFNGVFGDPNQLVLSGGHIGQRSRGPSTTAPRRRALPIRRSSPSQSRPTPARSSRRTSPKPRIPYPPSRSPPRYRERERGADDQDPDPNQTHNHGVPPPTRPQHPRDGRKRRRQGESTSRRNKAK